MGQRGFKGNLKHFKLSQKNIAYQNLWDAAKVLLTDKWTVLNAFIRKGLKPVI